MRTSRGRLRRPSPGYPFLAPTSKVSYYEDMYVQALDHFPGVRIDPLERKILFDLGRFYEELPAYFEEAKDLKPSG